MKRDNLLTIDCTAKYLWAGPDSYLLLAPAEHVAAAVKGGPYESVHEAGHVIVAHELGLTCDYASIILNAEAGTAGRVIIREHDPDAAVLVAGDIAVRVLSGMECTPSAGDAHRALERVNGNRRRLNKAKRTAYDILVKRIDDVVRITIALLARGRLTGDEIAWILATSLPLQGAQPQGAASPRPGGD